MRCGKKAVPQTSQHPSSVRRARSEALLQREHLRIFDVERRQMDEEIRQKILTLLDQHRIMTIATLRPDGWPQATTVGYANDGLTLYFLCGPESQKAANLARDDRVSLTIDHDTPQVMEITDCPWPRAHKSWWIRPK